MQAIIKIPVLWMEKLRLFLFPVSRKRQSVWELKENLEPPRAPPPDLAVSVLLPIIASLRHGEDGGRVNQWEQLPKEK